MHFVLEYLPKCLGEEIALNPDTFTLERIQRLMKDLISGVEIMHDRRIAHKDLKSDNLLLDQEDNLKILDFGLSN